METGSRKSIGVTEGVSAQADPLPMDIHIQIRESGEIHLEWSRGINPQMMVKVFGRILASF